MEIDSGQLRLRGRGLTLMGFLEPSLGFVWGEPIKVRQQKPVDEKYLDEAGPGPLQLSLESAGEPVSSCSTYLKHPKLKVWE